MVLQMYAANNSCENILVKRLNYWLKREKPKVLTGNVRDE